MRDRNVVPFKPTWMNTMTWTWMLPFEMYCDIFATRKVLQCVPFVTAGLSSTGHTWLLQPVHFLLRARASSFQFPSVPPLTTGSWFDARELLHAADVVMSCLASPLSPWMRSPLGNLTVPAWL